MTPSSLLFVNARKVDVDGEVEGFWMRTNGGEIVATGVGAPPPAGDSELVDVAGRMLAPGFIDLHGHGGGGAAVDDGAAAIATALATHRAHGTTRSVLSLVTAPLSDMRSLLAIIADVADADPLVLGSHAEGPFLAETRRGAHAPQFLRTPDPETIDGLIEAARGTLRQVTIAPELPGGIDMITHLVAAGIRVAIGHTEATTTIARAAFDAGASILTHAFNAMPGIHHREPGPVMAALEDDRVTLELVLDGLHVVPEVARLAFSGAPGRVALVTAAMAAAGAADGDWQLGSLAVTVLDGLATLRGTKTIAGSTLTQDRSLRIAVTEVGLSAVEAIAALTAVPAKALGLDSASGQRPALGRLAVGFAADAVVLTDGFEAESVWGDGRRLA